MEPKDPAVLLKALLALSVAAVLAALCLFLSAGSFRYWNAVACVAEFYALEAGLAVYLHRRNPGLLAKRMGGKEKSAGQRRFIASANVLVALSVLVLPGLDRRYGWSRLPGWASALAAAAMAASFLFQYVVVKENPYLYRTIEVSEGQKVVDRGLYARVRHPMYLSAIVIVVSMPLVLGSVYGFAASFALIVPLFAARIRREEKVLKEELDGYAEYMDRVRYRLVPFLW